MGSYIKFYVGLVLSIFLLRGIYDIVFSAKNNKCQMTYMYEYPQYIKLKISSDNQTTHQYGLYVYGEGSYAEELSAGNFNGIPVLFIPGNQGSFKQVRSLGSVAYRKAIDEKRAIHFNFFSVDFNEEISAFYGPVLERQTKFVALAIRKILQLYSKAITKPTSVILVGHSLGGLIARAVVTLPEIPASYIPLIISQGTPNSAPVIIPDWHIKDFYDNVNHHWEIDRYVDYVNTVFVSIGAGKSDYQVPNFFTSSSLADVDVSTLGVPSCWLTTDHLAIVWCKQLVLATVRALYDSVDNEQKKISSDRRHIIDAFKYQLLRRGGRKHAFPVTYKPLLTNLDRNGHWSAIAKRQYQHESLRPVKHTFLMLSMRDNPDSYQHISIIGKELDWVDWVFACKDDVVFNKTRMCSSGENLSQYGRIIPGNKKEANIKTKPLLEKGFTHVVVWIKPTDDRVQVAIDVNDPKTRSAVVNAPRFFSSFEPTVITAATAVKALTFNVTIKDFTELWQSYVLSIRPKDLGCAAASVARPHVSFSSSWHKQWEFVTSDRETPFDFPLEISVPNRAEATKTPYIKVHTVLHQNCVYEISIEKSYRGIFQLLAQLYGTQLPAFIVCHFVLILSSQLKDLSSGKKSSSVFSSVLLLSPVVVVPFAKMSAFVLSSYTNFETDFGVLARQGRDLGVLPIVLFLSTLPLSLLVSFVLWALVIISGNAAHGFAIKILKRTIRSGDLLTEVVVAGLWKVPFVSAIGLIAVAVPSCGTLSLCLAAIFYFMKVFKLYEDYLETFLISLIPGLRQCHADNRDWQLSSIHIHFTLMVISLLISLLNLPTLITWFNSALINSDLPSDPSLIPAVMCLVAQGILWQIKTIDHKRLYYKELGYVVHAGAVCIVVFGSIHLYRISYIVATLFLLVAAHQLLAPIKILPEETPTTPDDESQDKSKIAHMTRVEKDQTQEDSTSSVAAERSSTQPLISESETSAS